MCGLTFQYQPQLPGPERIRRAELALARLAHRGPDDKGLHQAEPWVIGHRRLAILDLEASRQPMADPERRWWLAFNGEIYNFRSLREGLAPHWQFTTAGDTEVVLAGLIVHGPRFLSGMEGMWAIVLWDDRDKTLLLARDRMGKKPLYYQAGPGFITCASEIPTLGCLSERPWTEDPDSTADYFRHGYYLPGTTAFREVAEVLPAHFALWNPSDGLRQEPYWSLRVGGFQGSLASATRKVQDTFARAVEKRLVADVEVGAFLSGGIDSSLVVATLAQRFGVRPKTFSIGFDDPTYDERQYARMVATRFGTDHREQCLQSWDRQALVGLVLDHVGQPFADSSLLPTAAVSRFAAGHVKVALSGDGGDELFSGYQRYMARTLLRWYTRLPAILRHNVEDLVRRLPEPMAHHSRSILKKAHLFLDIVKRQEAERPYVAPVFYSQSDFRLLLPDLCERGHRPPGLPQEARADDVLEMMAADALVYLPQDILVKVDRASMAYSLEARAPFLDRELVELAFSLPVHWHRRGFQGKRMLRSAFADLLPASLWNRRKQGFAVPVHEWFRGGLGNEMLEMLRDVSTPIDGAQVRRLLDEHLLRRRDHGYRLWAIYIYLLWHEQKPANGAPRG